MQKIKVEQNIIKSLTNAGESLTQYALDFIGPIMPYHVHRLCNLFKITNGEFEMVSNTYDSSAALNCIKIPSENADESENCLASKGMTSFLDSSESASLENNYGVFGESQAIKSVQLKEEMFCCNY